MSGDLGDMQDLLKIAGEIKVIKPNSSSKLQSQGGALSVTQKHVGLTSDAGGYMHEHAAGAAGQNRAQQLAQNDELIFQS